MNFENELAFEEHIRVLIAENVTKIHPEVYALKNKKAVDILICRDGKVPELFLSRLSITRIVMGGLALEPRMGVGFNQKALQKNQTILKEI